MSHFQSIMGSFGFYYLAFQVVGKCICTYIFIYIYTYAVLMLPGKPSSPKEHSTLKETHS